MPRDRRAQIAACVGCGLQGVLFAVTVIVGSSYHSPAIRAEAAHLGFGVLIWLTLCLLYTQRKRSGVEQLETEDLRRSREASHDTGLFSLEDDSMLVQRRRLNWMYRWFLPAAAVLLAVVLIAWNTVWYYRSALPIRDARWAHCSNPQRALPFVVGVTFLCFLYSRYVGGMARRPEWRFLRAASSFLAGNALMGLGVVLALALAIYQVPYAEPVVTYVIRLAMLVLGIEFLINFILDFYRPRVAGEETRPAFDSRLLGLVSEPGGIARSIQEAINYQFGFEVSATWFYQLLKRSLLPLAVFALLVMIGLSGVVIVDADEQAFVIHSGKMVQSPDKPLGPGLHFRYPWPIDRMERERVRQLRSMTVGEAAAEEEDHEDDHQGAILWTQEHEYVPEMMLVVASPQLTDLGAGPTSRPADSARAPRESGPQSVRGKSVAVSLIMASVALEYRVSDLFKFKNTYVNPEKLIEDVAHQALADYAAGIDVHQIMGPGRAEFNQRLRERLQNRLDELKVGVQLTFVGLQDAHPPSKDEVAQKFQDVIAAKSRMEAAVQAAVGQAERILTRVAGSRERALALDAAVMALERLSAGPRTDAAALASAWARVDELMLGDPEKGIAPMSGEASAAIAAARGEVSKMVSEAESKERTFENELAAFRAAPRLYEMRRYLDVMRTSLQKIRKVVNASQAAELVIIIETEKKTEFELPGPEE